MRQECIDLISSYIESKEFVDLSANKLNHLIASAKMYDNSADLQEVIEIIEEDYFKEISHPEITDVKLIATIKEYKQDQLFNSLVEQKDYTGLKDFLNERSKSFQFSNEQLDNIAKNYKLGIHHTSTANIEAIESQGLTINTRQNMQETELGKALNMMEIPIDNIFLNNSKNDGVFYSSKFILNYCKNSPEWFDSILLNTVGFHISDLSVKYAKIFFEDFLADKNLSNDDKNTVRKVFYPLFNKYLEKDAAIIFINEEVDQPMRQTISDSFKAKPAIAENICNEGLGVNMSSSENIPRERLTIAVSKMTETELENDEENHM